MENRTEFDMKNRTKFRVETGDEARYFANDARKWYERADVRAELKRVAERVREWMFSNKEYTDHFGNGMNGAWLLIEDWDHTNDPVRLELRRTATWNRLHEHGLRRFLNGMVDSQLLSSDAYEQFDVAAATFATKALHEQLVSYRLSPIPKIAATSLSLTDLRKRFNLSRNTNLAKIRNGRLTLMSSFGLWDVRTDDHFNYAIRAGKAAMIFHLDVCAPVFRHFSEKLNGNPAFTGVKK